MGKYLSNGSSCILSIEIPCPLHYGLGYNLDDENRSLGLSNCDYLSQKMGNYLQSLP